MDVFQPVLAIGGKEGKPFRCVGGTDGKLLTKIGVWAGESQFNAIRVWLADDKPITLGAHEPTGAYQEFAFDVGARITKLSLWGNGNGTRTGAMRFETNKGQKFDHGMTKWPRKQEYPIDIGSGICAGVLGNASEDHIDNMAFVFLAPVASARLIEVSYPTLKFDAAGISPRTLDAFSASNNGTTSRTWKFGGQKQITKSSSWSLTAGVEIYSEVSVQASLLTLVKVGGKFGWKLDVSGTYSATNSREDTLFWDESGELQPGQSISLEAQTREGKIDVPYTGKMEIVLKSGVSFSYPIKGQYAGLTYTGVEVVETPASQQAKAAAAGA